MPSQVRGDLNPWRRGRYRRLQWLECVAAPKEGLPVAQAPGPMPRRSMFCASISPTRPLVWRLVSLFVRLPRAWRVAFILELLTGDPAQDANAPTKIKPMVSGCSIKAARCSIKGHHTLPYTDCS